MKLVRVGRRVINLEYLILAEEWDGTPETHDLLPGGVRVTLETGRSFVLPPPEAGPFLRCLDDEVERSGPPCATVGRPFDPATGAPLGPPGAAPGSPSGDPVAGG